MQKVKRLGTALSVIFVAFGRDFAKFTTEFVNYTLTKLHLSFLRFEGSKKFFATTLYKQRGKYAQRFVHSGMAGLATVGMMLAPVIANEFPGRSVNPWEVPSPSTVLSAATESVETTTTVSDKIRDKVIDYTVQEGDTISSIAAKFDVSEETVLWKNDLTAKSKIKEGQTLEILPVTGVSHKVQKGDTVYSIAKKYDTSPQALVDFPYNTFVNDETFQLAVGQIVIVPEGVMPQPQAPSAPRFRLITPNAGTVVASGSFAWPTSGQITQNFSWYHPGVDIANRAAPAILAADAGTVVVAGWPDNWGYGNRVVINHGNGYQTLYAHMQKIYVSVGQTVNRGDAVGQMGSTGRSTGTHLHFEVSKSGSKINPLSVLK